MSVWKPIRSRIALAVLVVGAAVLALTQGATAQTSSDEQAGYVVFPKIVVDSAGLFNGGRHVDTLIQLTNTDSNPPNTSVATPAAPHQFHCFYINANSCCGAACQLGTGLQICDPNALAPCPGNAPCVQGWSEESNFFLLLTAGQTVGFLASEGLSPVPCDDAQNNPNSCTSVADGGVGAIGSPFVGELKCIEVQVSSDPNVTLTNPPALARNDLKGEARIYSVLAGPTAVGNTVDVREYNAVGFPVVPSAVAGGSFPGDTNAVTRESLCLGPVLDTVSCPTGAEYAACPDTIILNHFFDNATPFDPNQKVQTTLTLVPCAEDILTGFPAPPIRVQFAIYNEFEQRFSSSSTVNCFRSNRLADFDTTPNPADDATSVFSVGVQGTLTGQTRLRGVSSTVDNRGLIGIAEEVYTAPNGPTAVSDPSTFSDAFNLQYFNSRTMAGDVVKFLP